MSWKPNPAYPSVILFNGPPGCGKDTASNHLKRLYGGCGLQEKFARPVKEGCHGLFGITDDKGRVARHDLFESVKNDPHPEFMGLSPRAAYIWYSEEVMKPKFGQAIFGRLAVANVERALSAYNERSRGSGLRPAPMPVVLMSDSGFAVEAVPVIERFEPSNVLLVRILREGCSFENDSRSYIELPVRTVGIVNDGTSEYLTKIARISDDWLEGRL